jgi:excisionase family DNA binding protein
MEKEELLTVKQAAERLQLSPSTIYYLVKRGRLKRYPLGRLRFTRTDIEQLMAEEKGYLTVKEVAEWLRVAPSTVHKMVKQGRLKVYHVGKQLRFRREDVFAFLRGYHGGENPS